MVYEIDGTESESTANVNISNQDAGSALSRKETTFKQSTTIKLEEYRVSERTDILSFPGEF